jgi:AcrR family transcriptional regulator
MTPDGPTHAPPSHGTRDLILDAADQFLRSHSFRDLTVSGLMQATSVSRPAFYQYFRDRYDIAAALIDRIAEASRGLSSWLGGEAPPGAAGLTESIREYVRGVTPHAYVIRAVCDAASADERIDRMWRQGFVQRYIEGVARRIRVDQAAGRIPPDMDADLTARALVLLTERFTCDCLGKAECADEDQFSATLARIWSSTLYGGAA